MKSTSLIMVGVFLLCNVLQAQTVKQLTVGDHMPDIEIQNIVFSQNNKVKIADYKGKLLILDFWATWCQPCVAAFPKIDSLNQQFKDQVEILPVTDESKEKVIAFLNRYQKARKIRMASATEDKQLSKLFPFSYLPHTVWISGEGKIISISEGRNLTAKNIQNYLATGVLNLPLKRDETVNVLGDPPGGILMPGINIVSGNDITYTPIPESQHKLHTSLTGYIPGLGFGGSSGDSVSVNASNMTIKWLYRIALWKNSMTILNESKTVVDIKDAALYETIVGRRFNNVQLVEPGQEYLNWLYKNGYCYEIKVPGNMVSAKFDIMVKDLNAYFGALYGIEGVMEKRNAKYLALTRIDNSDKMASKGGAFNYSQTKVSLQVQKFALGQLLSILAQPLQDYPPLEDETNYEGRVDLELNCDLSNLDALNAELKKYGLAFIEKEKIMEVAVVRKTEGSK